MALFDDILAKCSEESRTVLAGNDQLKTALAEVDGTISQLRTQQNAWNQFFTDGWVPGPDGKVETGKHKLTLAAEREAEAAKAQAETLRRQVESLEKLQGTDMEWPELQKLLADNGYVSKTEVDRLVAEKLSTSVRTEDMTKTLQTFDRNYTAAFGEGLLLTGKHVKEFDEPLDAPALLKFMNDNQIGSMSQAYDRWISPRREERRTADLKVKDESHAAELEKVRKEGEAATAKAVEQAKQEAAMGVHGRSPTDGSGPALPFNPKRSPDPDFKLPDGASPGDGSMVAPGMQWFLDKQRQKAAATN